MNISFLFASTGVMVLPQDYFIQMQINSNSLRTGCGFSMVFNSTVAIVVCVIVD